MFLSRDNIFRFIIGSLILIVPIIATAQLHPISNHYANNPIAINPAVAGCDGALNVSMFYRNQWVGVNGSPRTMTFTLHTPLANERVGVGFLLIRDSYGIFRSTKYSGIYAHKIHIPKGVLSLGLSLSAIVLDEDLDEIIAVDSDDENLFTTNPRSIHPNFSAGLSYKTKKFFIGFSIPDLLSAKWNPNSNDYTMQHDFSKYNYFAYGGYTFNQYERWQFAPAVLIKHQSKSGMLLNISPQLIYNDKIGLGITYKTNGTFAGLILCNINNQTSFAYSYDFESGGNISHTGGSHEIMLKYIFKYDLHIESPR